LISICFEHLNILINYTLICL